MASATKFCVSPDSGLSLVGSRPDAIQKANEVLQENLDTYHMMYMQVRHNHVTHHVLTALDLGASADEIQDIFNRDKLVLNPKPPAREDEIVALEACSGFIAALDILDNYTNFLVYFQRYIEAHGVAKTVIDHVFDNNKKAEAILPRFFSILIHPVIHLGFALEFRQPALVAEALAQAAIHESTEPNELLNTFLVASEEKAEGTNRINSEKLLDLMGEIRANNALKDAWRRGGDPNKTNNVMRNAFNEIVGYASQYTVLDNEIEEKFAELLDVIPCTILSSDRPHGYKVDFFLLHIVNALIFLPTILKEPWMPTKAKCRLLEWFGRYCILTYASANSPNLSVQSLDSYKVEDSKSWDELLDRSINLQVDDGHLPKLMRVLMFAEKVVKQRVAAGDASLIREDLFLKLANVASSSVHDDEVESEERWAY